MAEIARWGGHRFEVSPTVIKSIQDIQIRGSCETEDTESGDKYTKRKAGNPKEVSFVIQLHAMVGVDVRNEAMAFIDEATAGKTDYLYVGGYKLISCKMMLIEASISETIISHNGTWIAASVMIMLRQCDGTKGSSAVPGSVAAAPNNAGWEKSSASSTPAASTGSSSSASSGSSSSGGGKSSLQQAQDTIRDITDKAKNASKCSLGGWPGNAVTTAATK